MIEISPRYLKDYKESRVNEYLHYLKGKRIIIVGPADYLVGQDKGEKIDQYDVIVRLNLGCPVPNDLMSDIGSRTDVLYHVVMSRRSISKRPDLFKFHDSEEVASWKNDGLQWFISKRAPDTPRVRKLSEILKGDIPWIFIPKSDMRKLEIMIKTNPNMGTVAIWHILQADIKSLHVTGCDYHRSGYHPGYGGFSPEQAAKGAGSVTCWGQIPQPVNPNNLNTHDVDKQLKYLARLLRSDKRFTVDSVLSEMLGKVL